LDELFDLLKKRYRISVPIGAAFNTDQFFIASRNCIEATLLPWKEAEERIKSVLGPMR
jgi:hypothetical protein